MVRLGILSAVSCHDLSFGWFYYHICFFLLLSSDVDILYMYTFNKEKGILLVLVSVSLALQHMIIIVCKHVMYICIHVSTCFLLVHFFRKRRLFLMYPMTVTFFNC